MPHVGPWSGWRRFAVDGGGASAVEFALIIPVLLTILFAIIKFGLIFNNYVELANGTRASARQFALARGDSTSGTMGPWTAAVSALKSSAPNLNHAQLTITLQVPAGSSSPCASDLASNTANVTTYNASCATALANAAGAPASVTAVYAPNPCSFNVMGINILPNCTMSSNTTELVE